MESFVAFPALGWQFPLNDTVAQFTLFGTEFTIKWYGVIIAAAFLLAVVYGMRQARRFGIDPDRMIDVVLVCTVCGFIGARLYYVLFSADRADYFADPLTILQVWNGGLGIYGGVIAAFLSGLLMCRLRKVPVAPMFDLAALGFLIGQSIGRWGNFFNQEAFGGNTTLPWGMTGNIIQAGINGNGYDTALPVHPTFLYESLWCVLGFVLLHILSKKAYKFKGQIFSLYVMWYGFGRFFIELTRTDSLMMGNMKVSCFVAILAVIGGGILYLSFRNHAQRLPAVLASENLPPIVEEEPAEADEEIVEEQTEQQAENQEEVVTDGEDS